jgi:hypothetical protein
MPDAKFNEAIDALRHEMRDALAKRDERCAARGETLARHQEHMDGVNGSLCRIDANLADMDAKLDGLCEAFAGWKGSAAPLISLGSALVGAVAATIITYLKTHLIGGTP